MNNCFKKFMLAGLCLVITANTALAEGDPEAGQTKVATCGACHGADGNSLISMYPSLAGMGEKYLLKQMRDIKNGNPEEAGRFVLEMSPPGGIAMLADFSDQDLEDIAAFYASQTPKLNGAKELDVKLVSGAKVDSLVLGEAVYRFGNIGTGVPACTGCHSPTGKGNAPAGYPRLSGQHSDYVSKQLKAFRVGDRANDGDQQTMRQVAEHLSDAEIAAVANYISGLH